MKPQSITTKPEGICRKQIVSKHNKVIIKDYCTNCKHIAQIDLSQDGKRCACCGSIIQRHQKIYATWMRRFEEIINDNQAFLDGFTKVPSNVDNRFFAWIKHGLFWYKIDMRYFVEFMDLAFIDGNKDEDRYATFFSHIEKNCPRIIL